MKWLTWMLLAANLAVAGYFFAGRAWLRTEPEAAPPLNVDRIALRSQHEAPSQRPAAARAGAADALCVEWRGLAAGEFAQVREQLKAMAGERVMSFTETPVNTRHWVIFPPLPSAPAAAAKLDELAAAGVTDAFVVKSGAWRNAISLGLYANNEAAQRRVREVEDKGVLGTRVELQPRQGTEFYFVIKSEDREALKSLNDIRQAYPNSRQSRVACPS